MKGHWGKFCDSCDSCTLHDAKFQENAIVPISGVLDCSHCNGKNVAPVQIDNMAFYYMFNNDTANPAIVPRYDSVHNCSNVICATDSDCKRFNCKTCVAGQCVA